LGPRLPSISRNKKYVERSQLFNYNLDLRLYDLHLHSWLCGTLAAYSYTLRFRYGSSCFFLLIWRCGDSIPLEYKDVSFSLMLFLGYTSSSLTISVRNVMACESVRRQRHGKTRQGLGGNTLVEQRHDPQITDKVNPYTPCRHPTGPKSIIKFAHHPQLRYRPLGMLITFNDPQRMWRMNDRRLSSPYGF
jgi:hypothetical protein